MARLASYRLPIPELNALGFYPDGTQLAPQEEVRDLPLPNKPVEDTVPRVNDDIAVGADMEFQRQWWRFERIIWMVFTLIVILDALGVFGRGYLAKGHANTGDGALDVHYERIERFSTPSILTVQFGSAAIHDREVQLWVGESLVRSLGNQRVVPQPISSVIGQGGILYTFPATSTPVTVQFALEPASLGRSEIVLQAPGFQQVRAKIFVMP